MYINSDFTDNQYVELQQKLKYNKILNKEFLIDVYNKNLNHRISKLVPSKCINDNIEHYYITNNIISSWINLIREWIYIGIRKDITTYVYWARVKKHPKYIKIGITYDINKRSEFENNKYYDYHVIRWCKNRYAAAYIEYKVRTLFCLNNSEIIDDKVLDNVINYIRNFHWKNEYKEELSILGWRF